MSGNREQNSSLAIQMAENGLLPDFLVRMGIRRLLRKRLAAEDLGNCADNLSRTNDLIQQFVSGPIAVATDEANEQHYEVPAAFFDLVLGARKKYSCCWYADPNSTLDQAEEAALVKTCRRAQLVDGQDILELGCGWGSLTLWMAEHFPNANITAVSNSRSQREFIERVARERGIDGNLTVVTCDMNEFDADSNSFDRVVSVEMFEHMRNYYKLMKQISDWLRPEGKLFVHIFCHRELTYEFVDRERNDWMSRYFFTGGTMPADDLLLRFGDHLKIEKQWRWQGAHYHRTCEDWLKNMDQRKARILPVLAETYGAEDAGTWFNRWRIFFLACSELFRLNEGNEWWVSHYRFENRKMAAAENAAQFEMAGV